MGYRNLSSSIARLLSLTSQFRSVNRIFPPPSHSHLSIRIAPIFVRLNCLWISFQCARTGKYQEINYRKSLDQPLLLAFSVAQSNQFRPANIVLFPHTFAALPTLPIYSRASQLSLHLGNAFAVAYKPLSCSPNCIFSPPSPSQYASRPSLSALELSMATYSRHSLLHLPSSPSLSSIATFTSILSITRGSRVIDRFVVVVRVSNPRPLLHHIRSTDFDLSRDQVMDLISGQICNCISQRPYKGGYSGGGLMGSITR